MSTQVEDHVTHWVVSTVVAEGKRHKLPRRRVRVGKSNPEDLRAEIIRQADAARRLFGLTPQQEEPVV